ncbi:hypothetical protein BT96DRAFT_994368 [Gymnopus androsaceus JB14]|uniref:Uncharacterized protein n=1 Tax=Gymnopus androsaceus JB14 TaxID=1447944 RepID=A0A6A4HNJ5_9AGAR|nr:hypothetical protein BT96DRAFT_994368 [Gymnopus androsaceus JB14]
MSIRSAGSSRHRDAVLWTTGGYSALTEGKTRVGAVVGGNSSSGGEDNGEGSFMGATAASASAALTQMSRHQPIKRAKPDGPREGEKSPKKKVESRENGWIWQRNVVMGQTEDEWAKEHKSTTLLLSNLLD